MLGDKVKAVAEKMQESTKPPDMNLQIKFAAQLMDDDLTAQQHPGYENGAFKYFSDLS